MRVTGVSADLGDLHEAGKDDTLSQGRSYTASPATVIAVKADQGRMGDGEIGACGPADKEVCADGVPPVLTL